MDKQTFVYADYSDKPTGEHQPAWALIPNTEETIQEAIGKGYTALSTMSFSHAPEKDKPEPARYGDLIIDFDCKDDPSRAIEAARFLLTRLSEIYGIELESIKYWMSGGKGCHILIPAVIFGGENGHACLPLLQKFMLLFLRSRLATKSAIPLENIIDMNLYCMGRGKLLRLENIKRENGRYKVPVSRDEFFGLDYPSLEKLTYAPRVLPDKPPTIPQKSQRLTDLFTEVELFITSCLQGKTQKTALDNLFKCEFIQHCYADQETLKEPEWWVLMSNLVKFPVIGAKLAHEFSQDYPNYSFEETQKKIEAALTSDCPKTLNNELCVFVWQILLKPRQS